MQCAIVFNPLQQPGFVLPGAERRAGTDALCASGAGEHFAFDGAWMQSHRAGIITGVVALMTFISAFVIKANDHGAFVTHP
jgi:hypothetical protein